VFAIGAEKLNTDLDVLKKAHDSVGRGARGIIFGRNTFMAQNPLEPVRPLLPVDKNGNALATADDRPAIFQHARTANG
jgi:hypothetical protein